MKKFYFLILLAAFIFGAKAEAHQPRYIRDNRLVLIENPGVSQAFYGELKGSEAFYLIDLKQEQDLYFQILVPDLPGIAKDKTVTVEYMPEFGRSAEDFAELLPASVEWKRFYEEYAGDNYWQGPDIKQPAEPGYYVIKVSSPDNTGKYVLVTGDKEEFPAAETINALITIPQLKNNFFQEPVSQWFNGKIGRYFAGIFLALIVFLFLFHRFNKVYK